MHPTEERDPVKNSVRLHVISLMKYHRSESGPAGPGLGQEEVVGLARGWGGEARG